MPEVEHYSNPMAPAHYRPQEETDSITGQPLTNDDFRKLLMTPAAPGTSSSRHHGSSTSHSKTPSARNSEGGTSSHSGDAGEKRKKKKMQYAKVIREEKAREEERAAKYRDRAKERRELIDAHNNSNNADFDMPSQQQQQQQQPPPQATSASNYKSVAPDAKGNFDAAARRKQMIDESKFLGGDLEHTHLVKGLDYALLQKVRAEITPEDMENDQPMQDDAVFIKPSPKVTSTSGDKKKAAPAPSSGTTGNSASTLTPEEEEEQRFGRSKMAKNIYRCLFRAPPRKVNELFLPHRMAYIIDLEALEPVKDGEERTEPFDDLPTTLIRSKADCPNAETTTTLSNNDIVINKLTQILSYLRHSKRDLKRQKKKGAGLMPTLGMEPEMAIRAGSSANTQFLNALASKTKDISMYDDVGEYVPDTSRRRAATNNERDKDRQHDSELHRTKKNYFPSGNGDASTSSSSSRDSRKNDHRSSRDYYHQDSNNNSHTADSDTYAPDSAAVTNFIKNVHTKYGTKGEDERMGSSGSGKNKKSGFQLKFSDDSYAECYPGTMAEEDVNIDSDDEPDFEKMDSGSKKGNVGRWDFDTAEEYSDYMGSKEAMPKAAFQYGVKMNDGRKTRRGTGPKDEKQKLEREWQQISKIIDSKRKGGESNGTSGGGGTTGGGESPPEAKRQRFDES